MESVEMMALITGCPDDAHDALNDLKRLEQAGWIDLTYYALVDRDPAGRFQVEEASDPVEGAKPARTTALAKDLLGHLAGEGRSGGVAAAMALGAGVSSAAGSVYADGTVESADPGLKPGESALLLVLDEHFSERVVEELGPRGRIVRRHLDRAERLAALRASIERMKMDVRWLEEFLIGELDKTATAVGTEKDDLETTIAAARAELGAQRENLHARLRVLSAELEADLDQNRRKLTERIDGNRAAIENRITDLERAMDGCAEELASSVLDHMDQLAAHGAELEERATEAGPDVELEIEGQLHELEVRMRKHRAELTAALGSAVLRVRQCVERLRTKVETADPEMKEAIRHSLRKLNERHTAFRADLRQIEMEETFQWNDLAAGLRQSWQALRDSIAETTRQF
jgi:uncharacterized membrane protein